MNEARSVRVALAIVATCTTAASAYAIGRVAQMLLLPEPDPALVLHSEHAGYFWRAWTSVHAGGTAGFVAYLHPGRAPARTARVLPASVAGAAALVVLQGVLGP